MQNNLLRNIIFIISLLIVVSIILIVMKGDIPRVDQAVIDFIEKYRTEAIMPFVLFITKFGSHTFLIPFTMVACLFLLWLYRSIFPPFILATGTITALAINYVLKIIIERERPQMLAEAHAEGFSFPSGHSMIPIVCYGLLMCFLILHPKTAKLKYIYLIFFPVLIIVIAISRLILNVHFFTDVITGLILGLNIVIFFFSFYRSKTSQKINYTLRQ